MGRWQPSRSVGFHSKVRVILFPRVVLSDFASEYYSMTVSPLEYKNIFGNTLWHIYWTGIWKRQSLYNHICWRLLQSYFYCY
jgi:hypothetical protein